MADTTGSTEFLRIEEASEQLLAELSSLRTVTVSFKEAHTTLAAASEKVGALAGSVGEIAVGVGETARALREIGTSQLLAKQEELKSGLEDASKTIAQQTIQLVALDSRMGTAAAAAARANRLLVAVAVGIAIVVVLQVLSLVVRR